MGIKYKLKLNKSLILKARRALEKLFGENLDKYIDLFFYEKEVILREEIGRNLEGAGILSNKDGKFYANVMVFPFRKKFIVTDFLLSIKKRKNGKYLRGIDDVWVMFPHETLLFIKRLKEKGKVALDLASGSGAISLFLADSFEKVYSLDINPKAVHYAKFNALLNNVEDQIINLQSDMFSAVKGKKFDFICWNGPTVAMPEVPNPRKTYPLYTYGGYDGAEFTKRFLDEALSYVNEEYKIKWWDGSLGTKKESVVESYIRKNHKNSPIRIKIDYLNKKGGVSLKDYDRLYVKHCSGSFDLNQNNKDRDLAEKKWEHKLQKEKLVNVLISIIEVKPSKEFNISHTYPDKTYVGPRHVFGFEWHFCSRKFIKNYLKSKN